ncbi:hypothetical protein GVAV_002956 [Gurleya vavrai]
MNQKGEEKLAELLKKIVESLKDETVQPVTARTCQNENDAAALVVTAEKQTTKSCACESQDNPAMLAKIKKITNRDDDGLITAREQRIGPKMKREKISKNLSKSAILRKLTGFTLPVFKPVLCEFKVNCEGTLDSISDVKAALTKVAGFKAKSIGPITKERSPTRFLIMLEPKAFLNYLEKGNDESLFQIIPWNKEDLMKNATAIAVWTAFSNKIPMTEWKHASKKIYQAALVWDDDARKAALEEAITTCEMLNKEHFTSK